MNGSPKLGERIRASYEGLSPAHRRVVDHLLADTTTAAFLTSDQLASKIGTSASTIVRCAMELGYQGYAALRRELQASVSDSLRPAERLERPVLETPDVVAASLQQDIENLCRLKDALNRDAVVRAVDLLERAPRVFVRAARTSEPVSRFFALSLSQMRSGTTLLEGLETIPELVHDVTNADVFVGIGLPRYTNTTIRVARFFRDRGASIIAITDSFRSPLASLAQVLLTVPFESTSFFNSNVPAFALVNVLLAMFAARRLGQIRERLERGEAVWEYFDTHFASAPQKGV